MASQEVLLPFPLQRAVMLSQLLSTVVRSPSRITLCLQNILELKHKLFCTNFELESARTKAKEEMMRSEANIKQLLQLLKIAYLERDEARGQLQRLLNNPTLQNSHQPLSLPPEITKEDLCFKQYDNCYSSYPSPLDCLSNANLPTTDLSIADMAESKQGFDYVGSMPVGFLSSEADEIDGASVVIENLVKRKPLPQKGRLLKTVIEAGPLLHTLLVVGRLPKWQNPPPLQNWKIPTIPIPIPIKEGVAGLVDQKPLVRLNCNRFEISQGCFQISPSSTSSSGHGSGSFLKRGCPSSDGTDGTDSDLMQDHIRTEKRRICWLF